MVVVKPKKRCQLECKGCHAEYLVSKWFNLEKRTLIMNQKVNNIAKIGLLIEILGIERFLHIYQYFNKDSLINDAIMLWNYMVDTNLFNYSLDTVEHYTMAERDIVEEHEILEAFNGLKSIQNNDSQRQWLQTYGYIANRQVNAYHRHYTLIMSNIVKFERSTDLNTLAEYIVITLNDIKHAEHITIDHKTLLVDGKKLTTPIRNSDALKYWEPFFGQLERGPVSKKRKSTTDIYKIDNKQGAESIDAANLSSVEELDTGLMVTRNGMYDP